MSAILSQIIRRQIATSAQRWSNAATAGEHSGKFIIFPILFLKVLIL